MNRADLQQLAELRIREAKCLLDTREHDFPDLELVRDSYKHDLQSLLRTAGLEPMLEDDARKNAKLAHNWNTVIKWSVDVRYEIGGLLGLIRYAMTSILPLWTRAMEFCRG